jgi:uncharacterized protein
LSEAGALVVAALSARVLAEAAVQAGHRVLALDCFGDVDTRRASLQWWPINDPDSWRIAPQRFLSALTAAAKQPGVQGWVAGAGFEDQPALLAQGATLLPLIGMGADEVRRLRHAKSFFACLDQAQIAHPEVRWTLPADRHGWWVKAAGGCGAWHIRAASGMRQIRRLPVGCYVQRDAAGTPMSATLLGDGQHIQLLGVNRQIMQRTAQHPFVYAGVVGPVAVPPGVAPQIEHIAQHLANTLRWRGLVSLDFLLDGDAVQVLELNPRPPASLVLYPGALAAHVQTCSGGPMPTRPWHVDGVRGQRIVFAPCAVRLNADIAQHLAESPHMHDLPRPGQEFYAGDPLCSVQVHGHDRAHSAHAASALLQQRHDDVLNLLENLQ